MSRDRDVCEFSYSFRYSPETETPQPSEIHVYRVLPSHSRVSHPLKDSGNVDTLEPAD